MPPPPQLPLMATPLPNLTVYYTGYRIYSHYRALQVGRALGWAGTRCSAPAKRMQPQLAAAGRAFGCRAGQKAEDGRRLLGGRPAAVLLKAAQQHERLLCLCVSPYAGSAAPSPPAWQGCKALEECLEQLNSQQLRTLRDEVRGRMGRGNGRWPYT